jgi:hypothetical protein
MIESDHIRRHFAMVSMQLIHSDQPGCIGVTVSRAS